MSEQPDDSIDTLPADTATDPATDPGTPSGSSDLLDLNDNGVPDALVVEVLPGVPGVLVDVDEDGQPDGVLIDTDGDGTFETRVTPDGAGGFTVAVDTNGDGVPESEETVSRSDLEVVVPGLADALDPPADGTGGTGGTTDPAGDGHVDGGRLIGDPREVSEHWFQQAADGFCAPASIAQIVSAYTGVHFADEQAFVQIANEIGVWTVGPDGIPSLSVPGALAVLEASGVPASVVYEGDLSVLAGYLDAGHGVIVAIDSGEVWEGEAVEDDTVDHAVVVAGIDVDRGVVLLSDPGTPSGDLMEVPVEVFLDAWADGGNAMIVADEPAPSGGEPLPVDGGEGLAASQIATVTARAVTDPWVLLPVALPTGTVVR